MSNYSVRQFAQILTLATALICAGAFAANAQTPAPTPVPRTPAQQDATRPPGTNQQQSIPEQARPITSDPTAPPGTQTTSPQAPPGTSVAPLPDVQTSEPLATPTPDTDLSGAPNSPGQSEPEQTIPSQQGRPIPPLPDLTRLGVQSDNMLSLSLNDAIRRALENNNDIEISRDDVKFNETTLTSLEGIFDPVFSLNPQYTNFVQSQQSTLGGASSSGAVSQSNFQFNGSVLKQFNTGGGNYEFFFNNNRQTTSSTFNQLNPVYSSSLGVTFTQPLLRDRSIDRTRHDIRIQRKRLAQSDADFRRKTIDIIAQVQRAYWDLVFSLRDQQNRVANLNLARESLRNVEARINAGASAPLERAEVLTELANRESDLLLATEQVSFAENTLKQLILRDPNAPEWTAQLTPVDEPAFDSTPVSLTDALEEAKVNRPELQRLRLQQDINSIDIKYFKNQTLPRLDLQTTLATTGLAGSVVANTNTTTGQVPLIFGDPALSANAFLLQQLNIIRNLPIIGLGDVTVPLVDQQTSTVPTNLIGGYGQTLGNLLGFGTRNIVVGVTLQFPFRNKTAQANLAGARIQRNQLDASMRLQEQTVIVEVRNAAQAVETARRRVLAARSALENAELQLTGEQRLYQVGRSTTFLLFQRESALANARNAEVRAVTDYNKALADLQRATSTTLRANNIVVETSAPR